MNKRIFSTQEQKELCANENIHRCSERSVTYTKTFKIHAIKQYSEGMTSAEVFKQAGFNLDLIGRDTPKECLHRWRKIHKEKGFRGLSEARGRKSVGRTKEQKRSQDEQVKYLEAEVKYLKAENSFLAKLRAKKAE